jgi:hypothetical protein
MKILLLLSFMSLTTIFWGQTTFQIRDAYSNEMLSFVKVIPEKDAPLITDLNGTFQLKVLPQFVQTRLTGYRDSIFELSENSPAILHIRPILQQLQEVTILPGVNPAHRIIEKTINNRKKNHPYENDGFIAEQYSKFLFDLDAESRQFINDTSIFSENDTVSAKLRNFFNRQYLFLIETSSKQYFEPPFRQKEVVDAYKVSGFSDPIFATFAKEMQSFHFYDNQVSVLGKDYVNPIAFGGINRYLFILEDTTINQKDTTFTIFYRPKKGKNFDGLTGRLYINTNNFAIEKVTATPHNPDSTQAIIHITQEYRFEENTKWFPYKLSTTIDIFNAAINLTENITFKEDKKPNKIPNTYLHGSGYTAVRKVQFNPKELDKERFNNQATTTLPDAGEQSNTALEQRRSQELTEREKNTYIELDRFVTENKLDRALSIGKILASGKIPMGHLQWDINRFLDYNAYEGIRLGAGLETSEKLVKWLTVGGHFGYGTKDKMFKYGAFGEWRLHLPTQTKFRVFWQNDVIETASFDPVKGGNLLTGDNARRLFVNNMAMVEQLGAQFKTTVRSNMHFTLRASKQNIQYHNDYQFQGQNEFEALTTSLIWNWNIREKVNLLGNTLVPLGTKFPRIQAQLDRGWSSFPGISGNFTAYNRFQIQIQQQVNLLGKGKLNWMVRGAWSEGNLPLFFQTNLPATFANWAIDVPSTFQTVEANEFYHQKSLSAFLRWFSPAIKTKAKWNEPKIGLHYAVGIGAHENKGDHSIYFRSMEKGLHEGGLMLDGLFVSGNTTFGVGAFYRFGYYAQSDWKANLVPKIVLGFNF